MTNAPDWLSDNRAGILAMAQAWCTIFREQVKNEKGEEAAKYAAWGIPFTVFSLFMETYVANPALCGAIPDVSVVDGRGPDQYEIAGAEQNPQPAVPTGTPYTFWRNI